MNFTKIDISITPEQSDLAHKKFQKIITELGVRNNNEHIGSGLGGNNFQLFVLLDLTHSLVNRQNKTISFFNPKRTINWNAEWLISASLQDIRIELDKVFNSSLDESYKYKAIAMQALVDAPSLRIALNEYEDQFSQLMHCLNGNSYLLNQNLTDFEKLILALIMCQDLAVKLDTNDHSIINVIGTALYEFSPEIILIAIRKFITIDRLIKYNLIDNSIFNQTLMKVNNVFL